MKNLKLIYSMLLFITLILIAELNIASVEGAYEKWGKRYYNAGTIKINDPKMGLFGSVSTDKALMHINLIDIAKLTGHLCGGSASGFFMTKLALENLYEPKEIPCRGDIKLTSNANGDLMDVAAYIVGVSKKDHYGHKTLILDKKINTKKGILVLIFERFSTGKKVRIQWDKVGTLTNHVGDLKRFKKIKVETIHGKANKTDSRRFKKLLNSFVNEIIKGNIKYDLKILNKGKSFKNNKIKKNN